MSSSRHERGTERKYALNAVGRSAAEPEINTPATTSLLHLLSIDDDVVKSKESALALVYCGILGANIALGYLLFRRIKKKPAPRSNTAQLLGVQLST
ncbi:hypothetical protein T4C_1073 [Trichinella pseudospiralis]|uniref:Uncharacterized protein n=1 Tax=Trichinella pseudospiralis TaxID=6337 RepID=A0A0V1JPN8_TRIPS|nr:hypothetical protein T4D_13798 [Trichinella pseudospiralis]KRZ36942.1 hypothetical protein T4C_1073 [Trichinella pseudospiralis]